MKSERKFNRSAGSKRRRQTIRLQDWDYASPAAYFVTICTHNKNLLFGEVIDDKMVINEYGQIALDEWKHSADIRKELAIDAYVVMPNHLHGIVFLQYTDVSGCIPSKRESVGAHGRAPLHRPPQSLGSFIAGYKARVTKRINQSRQAPGARVWQRGYYDHIIRDEEDLRRIQRYIELNPLKWALDPYHPKD